MKNDGDLRKTYIKKVGHRTATNYNKIDEENFDNRAIQAIQDRLRTPDAVAHLSQLIDTQDGGNQDQLKLSKEATRLQEGFKLQGKLIGKQIEVAGSAINAQWATAYDMHRPRLSLRERLHVFGADRDNSGGPEFYHLTWRLIDGGNGEVGVGAGSSLRDGNFWASQYATGSTQRSSYSGIGVRFKPSMDWCMLSVRPFVNWSGFDILNHKEYDPQLKAKGWGVAGAQIGIHIQSWDNAGGAFYNDAGRWLTVWERQEINPSGTRYYNDTVNLSSLQLPDVLASGERTYAIWVSCRSFVISEAKFGLDTRASSYVSCQLPFLVVEEIDV